MSGELWVLMAFFFILGLGVSLFVLKLTGSSQFETVFRKGMVQPIVTHIMAWTFALMATVLIVSFLYLKQYGRAENIFSYVVAVIGPIIGFWFGSRSQEGTGPSRVQRPPVAPAEGDGA